MNKRALLLAVACCLLFACEQSPGQHTQPSLDIRGAEDLARIGVDPDWPADGDYTLGADISLRDWEPLGAYDNRFRGTFYGRNHTITIENGKGGLFAYAAGATIKNLKVAGTIAVTAEAGDAVQVGGIAGYIERTTI